MITINLYEYRDGSIPGLSGRDAEPPPVLLLSGLLMTKFIPPPFPFALLVPLALAESVS